MLFVMYKCLQKNMNASKPSERPYFVRGMVGPCAPPQSECRGIINLSVYSTVKKIFSLHHVARCHIRPEVTREASASGIDPRSLLSLNSSAYLNDLLAETVVDNGQVKYSS